jgi:hypothetical protein
VIVIVFIFNSLASSDHAVKQAGLMDVPNGGHRHRRPIKPFAWMM